MNLFDRLQRHLDEGVVGFPTALASSVGVILASPVILTVTTGFGLGGGAFAAAMAVALFMMLCQSFTFAEAMSILPTSGSVYDYISCGLGRCAAITGTMAACLPFLAMLALTALYALIWSVCVLKAHPFRPVPVERILEEEFEKNRLARTQAGGAAGGAGNHLP